MVAEKKLRPELTKGPKIFYDDQGNKVGILLTHEAFEALVEQLEDAHDLYTAYKRMKKGKTIPFDQIKKELFGHAKK